MAAQRKGVSSISVLSTKQTPEAEVPQQAEKLKPDDQIKVFPDITEVNLPDDVLINYLTYKVTCFKAGRLKHFYAEWASLTSDTEILHMISGQKLEFWHPPYQVFVPRERNDWDATQTQTFETEIKSLLQ